MTPIFKDDFIVSSDVSAYSPVKDYLKDRTVFVTGGLGFLGKLLIEKLLRCDVKKIYLLAREKKGKSVGERMEKFMAEPVSYDGKYLSKFSAQSSIGFLGALETTT
jgi:Male sterility protein